MNKNILSKLTWGDVKEVVMAADKVIDSDVKGELPPCCDTEEGYYSEVLSRLRKENGCKPPCSELYPFILSKAEEAIGRKLTSARNADNTLIRCFVAHKMHQEGYSLSEIGKQMHRDHSTISHLDRLMSDMLSVPNAYKKEVELYTEFKIKTL